MASEVAEPEICALGKRSQGKVSNYTNQAFSAEEFECRGQ